MTDLQKITRALISVSDKGELLEIAKVLAAFKVFIVFPSPRAEKKTGGAVIYGRYREVLAGWRVSGFFWPALFDLYSLQVVDVSDHTGFPEIMDGRVKTLHPKIH